MLARESLSQMQRVRGIDHHEVEGRGIPFYLIQELLLKVEYASVHSVGVKLLFFTGCRLSELQNMYRENICENYLYWKCGKNQEGFRREYLPDDFLNELKLYWCKTSMPSNRVFSTTGQTFSTYFSKHIRQMLGSEWQKKRKVLRMNKKTKEPKIKEEYAYQLKGFRKNFATLLFSYFWQKYNSPNVSVDRVSKRMKHSSNAMTSTHYIETMEQIEAEKFCHLLPFEVLKNVRQVRILDYFN